MVILMTSCHLLAKEHTLAQNLDKEILNIVKPIGDNPMASFEVLMNASKTNPRASYYAGVALQYHMNELSDAEKLYRRAIQLYKEQNNTSDITLPLHNLGMLMLDSNRTEEGLQLLQNASDLGYQRATYNLAFSLHRAKDYYSNFHAYRKIEIGLWEKLLKSKKYKPVALTLLGLIYMNPPKETANYELSLKYLIEAANEYKVLEAYQSLSTLYMHRETNFKSIEKGIYWQIKYYSDRFNKLLPLIK
jgi:hypothetical protein